MRSCRWYSQRQVAGSVASFYRRTYRPRLSVKSPSTMTFAAATDGNHGRSVAWGAQLAGARCEIFIHAGVSEGRAAAMAAFGAKINRIDGSYDNSVELAASNGEGERLDRRFRHSVAWL